MTIIIPPQRKMPPQLKPEGCAYPLGPNTWCDRQDTTTVDGVNGRRCPDHPPAYQRAHADALLAAGRAGAAFAYLRTALAHGLIP